MTLDSLDLAALQVAARHAWRIALAYPWRLIGCTVLVLFAVDLLNYVPSVGFLFRIALGSLLFAQILVLFREAARGEEPKATTLVQALSLPMSSQFALVLSEWAQFALALAFLWQAGGNDAVHAFFADARGDNVLDETLSFEFKVVLFVVSAPLTFLAPAIVLAGAHGLAAVRLALQAALRNPLFVVLLLCLDVVLEFVLARIGGAGTLVYLPVLVLSLVYELALLYTVSMRVFRLAPDPTVEAPRR